MIKVIASDGHEWPVRAFLDSGSQVSCISEGAVQMLRLSRHNTSCQIIGIGGSPAAHASGITKFTIKSRSTEFAWRVTAVIMKQVTRLLPRERLPVDLWPQFQSIQLADPEFGTPAPVDILLGADVIGHLYTAGFLAGDSITPHAMNTQLGWIVFGAIRYVSMQFRTNTLTINSSMVTNEQLEVALRRLCELQEPTERLTQSQQEIDCEQFYKSTMARSTDGRYIVRIPFTSDPSILGDSREIALKQFYRMENRLSRDGNLRERYTEFMDKYISLGHMFRANGSPNPKRVYYIPHHPVLERFRVVFNASQKTSTGVSLNELQMVGPTIQSTLLHILLRFRTYRIALASDVEKMFRQILVHQDDRDLQRIFWRPDRNQPVAEYQLATVTYGMASAPFNAIRTLQQCAHDYCKEFPMAANHVLTHFYVDDYLGGSDTVEEAIELKQTLDTLLQKGGFDLRKWKSNDWNVIERFSDVDGKELDIKLHSEDHPSVLGLKWDVGSDAFCFSVKPENFSRNTTKRIMLSEVLRLFDPTGFLSPVTIVGKTMIQQLWQLQCGWDEQAPTHLQQQWTQIQTQLNRLNELKIERWIGTTRGVTTEIHIFCDASSIAYAAVAYAKTTSHNSTSITIVAAKAKVAPVKTICIPRLELCAAQLGTQLYLDMKTPLNLTDEPVYFWSDSTVTLAWLNKSPNSLKVYVANRVSHILTHTKVEQWNHVPSTENPADCASRGLQPKELVNHRLWWHGPKFLADTQDNWPTGGRSKPLNTTEASTVESEVRNTHIVSTITTEPDILQIDSISLVERYSSLEQLLRITAYCLRSITRKTITHPYITIAERDKALRYWIAREQHRFFSLEISSCHSNKELAKHSKLYNFGTILDDDGILRMDGRLNRAPLPYDARHPIILHQDSPLASLLVADAHRNTIHGGTQLMLNYLRQKFWILQARTLVKRYRSKCVTCFRTHPVAQQQRMADLPAARITPAPPFDKTAIDYLGPVNTRSDSARSRAVKKGFVAVFVCLATKAIHLECVTQLTTQAFLATLARFTSRRGHCSELWSDNATYFVGAQNEWKALKNSRIIPESLANTSTKWNFIPPGSPHHGGLHEAGVRSVKAHLKHILHQQLLTYEELSTVLTRIEACLNSRPMVALVDEPQLDSMILSPGHFLIGRPLIARPDVDLSDTKLNRLTRWQLVQRMHQDFWKVWSQDYLNTLRQRHKWQDGRNDVEVGDVVIIRKENLPPLSWLMGRITAVHPGADGRVRVVTIKTPKGELKRAVQKICILPIK